jgi:mannose-1-phosphate guanylyltransferase
VTFHSQTLYSSTAQYVATVALTTSSEPTEFGQIKLHGTHLTKFYLNTDQPGMKSHLIHTGIYAFEPSIFNAFPEGNTKFSLEDVIRNLIVQQEVSGFVFEGSWFDVGNPQNYEKGSRIPSQLQNNQ